MINVLKSKASKYRNLKKQKCIDAMGGKCQCCGYNKCNRALVFHHINPNEKEFTIATIFGDKWKIIESELKKCILLCSNCHMELHENLISIPTSYQKYDSSLIKKNKIIRTKKINKLDWKSIQTFYNNCKNIDDTIKFFKISKSLFNEAIKNGFLIELDEHSKIKKHKQSKYFKFIFSYEEILIAVQSSKNLSQTLKFLGLSPNGRRNNHLRKLILKYKIDSSHFKNP